MAELSTGETKLVQYLNEAYGLESRLQTALEAHLTMTSRPAYKKRLKEHLTETKRHAREVKQSIKRLGGVAETISAPGTGPIAEAAQAVVGGAQKAVALAQGSLHALRGTGEEEKQLKNAKTEYASEAEEIATYTAIEALAEALGDTETRRVARSIRREEQRMLSFLEKEIHRLTNAVAKAEIPASERSRATRRKASSTRKAPAARKAVAPKAKAAATPKVKAKAAAKASATRKPASAKASAARKPARKAARKAAARA